MKQMITGRWSAGMIAVIAIILMTGGIALAQSGSTHTVQPGETLFIIAVKYNTTIDAIAFANGITNPNLIYAGQILTIPGATGGSSAPSTTSSYTVRTGDTLYAIARRFGTTIDVLISINNLSNPNLIRVGQSLTIPGQAPAATATTMPTRTPTRIPTNQPTARPTATPANSQNPVYYTVKSGDTLYYIALQFNTSVQQLVQMNNLANPNLIIVGQQLLVSGASSGTQPTISPSATQSQGTPILTNTPVPQITATSTQASSSGVSSATPTPRTSSIVIPSNAPNLLINGGFEGTTRNVFYSSVKVVNGWEPYYCAAPYVASGCTAPENSGDSDGIMGRPAFGITTQSGNSRSGQAQYWSCNGDTCRGGIYQTVSTRIGATCRAGAYVKSWSAPTGSLVSTARYNSYWFIRVDTSGGTTAFSPNTAILLSRAFDISDGHYDQFVEISYVFQATSTNTTVFFENLRLQPQSNNYSYIDSAYLVCNN